MPYGRGVTPGGFPVLQRFNAQTTWVDAGGSVPIAGFTTDLFEVAPGDIFHFWFANQITLADSSGNAFNVIAIGDDAQHAIPSTVRTVTGPIPQSEGNSGGLSSTGDVWVAGLPTPGAIRVISSTAPPAGPPLTPAPGNPAVWAINELMLNANLFRIVLGSNDGTLEGNVMGYVTKSG